MIGLASIGAAVVHAEQSYLTCNRYPEIDLSFLVVKRKGRWALL